MRISDFEHNNNSIPGFPFDALDMTFMACLTG